VVDADRYSLHRRDLFPYRTSRQGDPRLAGSPSILLRFGSRKYNKMQKWVKYPPRKAERKSRGSYSKGQKMYISLRNSKRQNYISSWTYEKLFTYKISSDDNGNISLTYEQDIQKYNDLVDNFLGKSILFTNRDNWTNEQIILTYRAQYHDEENFKQLKNIIYLSFRPIRHFTDNTIRVYTFYCVFALTLSSLLRLEMENLRHNKTINSILKGLKSHTIASFLFKYWLK
jgi:transposase